MPSALPRVLLAAALLAAAADPAAADAVSAKQKAAALANMKKAQLDGAAAAESDHLIVVGTVPEAKLKAMGTALDKTYLLARKTLKYDDKDKPLTGKLTVYYLPDRQFKPFIRTVANERPGDTTHFALKGDEPFVAVSPELPEKAPDADVTGELGAAVAAAVFMGRSSTEYPDWVRTGFARATALRAEGPNSRRVTAFKAQARALVTGSKGARPPAPIGDVWGGRTKDSEVLATSLMDYIAFGAGPGKLESFLNGFKPTESVPMPGVPQALEAAGWKEPQLEAAWRKWVQSGK